MTSRPPPPAGEGGGGEVRIPLRAGRDGGAVRAVRDRGLVVAGLVCVYVWLTGCWLAVLVWSALPADARGAVRDAVLDQVAVLALVTLLASVGLFLLLGRTHGRYALGARRMAADVRLVTVNPSHRLPAQGPRELRRLAAVTNGLAERRQRAEEEVTALVAAAHADLAEERNRLAALMAELTVPVVVVNTEGRILLYNEAARELVADDAVIGLGRSVFAIVDRDVVLHALARLREGVRTAQVATTVRGRRLWRVRLAPVRDAEGDVTGVVLVLEDLTAAGEVGRRRDRWLRDLSRGTRSSVASIRAAIETVLDYPDMEPAQRTAFLHIVREEAERLGDRARGWFDSTAIGPASEWLPTDMNAADLLAVLRDELARAGHDTEVLVAADAVAPESAWLRVDSHVLSRATVRLADRARPGCDARDQALAFDVTRRHAALDLRWLGSAPSGATFSSWLAEPLGPQGSPTVKEVVDRHGGEIWTGRADGDAAHVRILLPLVEGAARAAATGTGPSPSRPEFYDFDLFTRTGAAGDALDQLRERRLDELTFTVFDTETTGLDPAGGDEIISIGAVRCMNGRLLRGETFERLVDPRRAVPEASVAIHGITREMLAGQPTIGEVLPAFARWADDTVLVGHNVAFDLRFLRLKEAGTGVVLVQPVLDTLMLDAVLHPDHDDHTLEAIAARIGVPVVGRHTALGDALVTAEVLLAMVTLLAEHGITTLGAAIDASRETSMARVDRRYDG